MLLSPGRDSSRKHRYSSNSISSQTNFRSHRITVVRIGTHCPLFPPKETVMRRFVPLSLLACLLVLPSLLPGEPPGPAREAGPTPDWANTYSLVAYDPERQEWGVVVASKYLAVGAAVPFARAGVGA